MYNKYDIIVVGAGHAGCEAAAIAANMGKKVLLITMNMQVIGQMSCNPAMGGIAKGQIVREIDALGGYSGIVSDISLIQFRMLNASKGGAMWSPRTQNDRMLFAATWREKLEQTTNLDFWQDMVKELIIEKGKVVGVITSLGVAFHAHAVILTNGTFLNGIIHIGEKQMGGGRAGESAAKGITEQLTQLGFEAGRMKTGTPPRIDGRSIDYSKCEVQEGDKDIIGFSYLGIEKPKAQKCCWITYTNAVVHALLKEGFEKSPMFTGRIQGRGPRYCPSIEDKITRFEERERHQLFIEPEGWQTIEIYLNGFSTSLPEEVQYKAMTKIPGLENVKMFRPGYAIEYDYFPPTQLTHSLETKLVKGLFFAGQINGTTGYEEAACQGLMAGINAVQYMRDEEPVVLNREDAYIGVLIDDLITKGTEEPYRMFTSRAEYRLLLRQDNADLRLTPIGDKIGSISQERKDKYLKRKENINQLKKIIQTTSIKPEEVNVYLEKSTGVPINQGMKLINLITRPDVSITDLKWVQEKFESLFKEFSEDEIFTAEIELKYEGYIKKEREMVEKQKRLENIRLSENIDYQKITSLSAEAREKLNLVKPKTLAQAGRISGISPADISVLLVYVGR